MKATKLLKQTALALVFAALGAGSALATPAYYTFTFSGPEISGSGDFWANPNGDGTYTAISGSETDSVTGVTSTLITNPAAPWGTAYSPSGAFYYDDQYQPNADPVILLGGLMFTGANGLEVNLWSTGPNSYVYDGWQYGSYSFGYSGTPISFEAVDPPPPNGVPEPATVGLVGLGLLGVVLMRRRAPAALAHTA